jgi:hypothetical protein
MTQTRDSKTTMLVAIVVIVGLILVTAVAVGIAVPSVLRARMRANETSAIASLRAINSAQAAFASSCGNGMFASTLAGLAAPAAGAKTGFVSPDLGSDPVRKSGYTIRLTAPLAPNAPRACNGAEVAAAYFVAADPVGFGSTGSRYFATNQSNTIYQSPSSIDVSLGGPPPNAAPIQGSQ